MADYTRPIREELARAGGILERGLTRKSQHALADKELDFAQKVRMTGLGMEKERLDIARKGAESARKTAGLQRTKLRQDIKAKEDAIALARSYVPDEIVKMLEKASGVTMKADLDTIAELTNEDVASGLLGNLPPDRTTVNDDGTVSHKITTENFLKNLGIITQIKKTFDKDSEIQFLKPSKSGEYVLWFKDGTKQRTGVFAQIDTAKTGKDTPAQKRDKKKFDSLVNYELFLRKKLTGKDMYGNPQLSKEDRPGVMKELEEVGRQIKNWDKPKPKRGTLDQEFREATGKKPQMNPVNRKRKKTDWRTYAVE